MNKLKNLVLLVSILLLLTNISGLYAQYDQNKTYTFLKEMFDRHDKKLRTFLITELFHYIKTFPEADHAADVYYLLGKAYEEQGANHEALATYLKMIYLFPENPNKSEWADLTRQIIAKEKKYNTQKSKILASLELNLTQQTAVERYYEYLNLLITVDQPKLYDWTIKSCRDYIRIFPDDKRTDRVTLWLADLYSRSGNNQEAEASMRKFNIIFSDSPLLGLAMYKRGALLHEKLKQSDLAIEELTKVLATYPDSSYAADALFLLGKIKEKKKKDYQAANIDYRKLADTYPESPKVNDALFAMAEITKVRLKDAPAAVSIYNEIVEKDSTGVYGSKALEEIAAIYKKNLKDYTKAAETYKRIADTYPNYEKVADRLYDAGIICERRLKNNQKAIEYYQLILDKYPTHKKAKDAEKKLARLKQE